MELEIKGVDDGYAWWGKRQKSVLKNTQRGQSAKNIRWGKKRDKETKIGKNVEGYAKLPLIEYNVSYGSNRYRCVYLTIELKSERNITKINPIFDTQLVYRVGSVPFSVIPRERSIRLIF